MRLAPLSLVVVVAAVAAAVLAGCGNTKTPAPETGLIPAPKGFREIKYSIDGISVRAPVNWRLFRGTGTQLVTMAIGDAQIAIWHYARAEPLPLTRSQLHAAREALVAQVQRRDSTFELTSSRLVIKRGLRAIEIVGQGSNQGQRRSVRSLHAYGHGQEVVVDAFAPPKDFARVDEQTFGPVTRSLRLLRPA